MADFKFSCPHCGQHIQCDSGYSGAQINCPSCQQAIVVPQAPRSAATPSAPPQTSRPAVAPYVAPPPPVPPPATNLATKQSTTVPAGGRRFAGAPGAQPPAKPKSKVLRNVLIITASVVVLAGLVAGGWFGFSKIKEHKAAKGNPAAQVPTPTATATTGAMDVLAKAHQAYTNSTSYSADLTVTVLVDLSRITIADVSPNLSANAKNATRRPPNMPVGITNTTDLSIKRSRPASFRIAGDSKTEVGRKIMTNTFAFWSSDKGTFMFMDSHQRMNPATYMQLPDANTMNGQSGGLGVGTLQHFFDESGVMTKLIKDLGQTDDESVDGQDCYTLTAKVLGQKVKVWVNKTSYLVAQWQLTLGGAISDADIDDAFALFSTGVTTPQAQMDQAKAQFKQIAPAITKIRGTVTATYNNIETNLTFAADDFNYTVPKGVRLTRMPGTATSTSAASSPAVNQRNACINNLRQIDAAKNEFALEKGKKNGDPVTEADIKPYIKLDASGNIPKCPGGGTYTIGKVGEKPTCSIAGHALP